MPNNIHTKDPMSDEELDAIVYKVVRANQDKPKKTIMTMVKMSVPIERHVDIPSSLIRLSDKCD